MNKNYFPHPNATNFCNKSPLTFRAQTSHADSQPPTLLSRGCDYTKKRRETRLLEQRVSAADFWRRELQRPEGPHKSRLAQCATAPRYSPRTRARINSPLAYQMVPGSTQSAPTDAGVFSPKFIWPPANSARDPRDQDDFLREWTRSRSWWTQSFDGISGYLRDFVVSLLSLFRLSIMGSINAVVLDICLVGVLKDEYWHTDCIVHVCWFQSF